MYVKSLEVTRTVRTLDTLALTIASPASSRQCHTFGCRIVYPLSSAVSVILRMTCRLPRPPRFLRRLIRHATVLERRHHCSGLVGSFAELCHERRSAGCLRPQGRTVDATLQRKGPDRLGRLSRAEDGCEGPEDPRNRDGPEQGSRPRVHRGPGGRRPGHAHLGRDRWRHLDGELVRELPPAPADEVGTRQSLESREG